MAFKFKVTSSVVDGTGNLVGFTIRAKSKYLGGVGEDEVEQRLALPVLASFNNGMGFKNHQLTVTKNGVNELSGFKINTLPMYTTSGNLVDNSITITKRYMMNSEPVGYEVKFSVGEAAQLKTNQLIAYSKWFKPTNFTVMSNESRQWLRGNGCSLNDLPTVNVDGSAVVSKAKYTKSGAVDKTARIQTNSASFDVLDIYNAIAECNGNLIFLPNEEYKATTISGDTEPNTFINLNIGEIASPKIKFNYKKLNVNGGFKKIGIVNANIAGQYVQIPTYTYRTKSIFYAGQNHVKKFGVAIPIAHAEKFVQGIGKSLALSRITDTAFTSPMTSVINNGELAFFIVNTGNIGIISDDKRKKSVLSATKIAEILRESYADRIIAKALSNRSYTGTLKKEIIAEMGESALMNDLGLKPVGAFATMRDDMVEQCKALGFNVYDGSYNVTSDSATYSKKESADSIEIEYTLEGYNPDKFKSIGGYVANGRIDELETTPGELNVLRDLMKIADKRDRYIKANELCREAEAKVAKYDEILWKHIASMYIASGKTSVHSHDKSDWVEVATRSKKATVKQSTKVDGLKISVTGVNIG